MSKYKEYAEKPIRFLALTGYTRKEFDNLLPPFSEQFHERMKTYNLDGSLRGKRKYSEYNNSPLPSMADKLFFILSYLKTNNLQEVQGAWFGISQPKANQWIHTLLPVLNKALAQFGQLPARKMEEIERSEQDTLYFHEGTERPIQRPRDDEEQRQHYRGKKTAYGQKQCHNQYHLPHSFPDRHRRRQEARQETGR